MTKKILSMAALVILCFGTLVFAQNSNSSTTMQPHDNMNSMKMSARRGRRRHRRMHRRHRHMKMHMKMDNKNANM
ncbi:MAG: hypothetical protein ACREA9_07590 [Pyrinomonadaceae bacterium]